MPAIERPIIAGITILEIIFILSPLESVESRNVRFCYTICCVLLVASRISLVLRMLVDTLYLNYSHSKSELLKPKLLPM